MQNEFQGTQDLFKIFMSANKNNVTLLNLFPKNILIGFCNLLYNQANELYFDKKMIEKAQVEKLLFYLTDNLKIEGRYLWQSQADIIKYDIILSNQDDENSINKWKSNQKKNQENKSINEFRHKDSLSQKSFFPKIFSTMQSKIYKQDADGKILTCNYCGLYLKIGDLTIRQISFIGNQHVHYKCSSLNN